MNNRIGSSIPRIDGKAKAAGTALFVADIPHSDMLRARFCRSTVTRGKIKSVKRPAMPDGYFAVDHRDVTGANHIALIKNDWPAFAVDEIRYFGQIILLIAGPCSKVVDELVSSVEVEYESIEPSLSVEDSLLLKGGAIHGDNNLYADLELLKGDPDSAFAEAVSIVEGEYRTGFQEQLYLEPQGLIASFEAAGRKIVVRGSMQCPFSVKHAVEEAVGPGFEVRVIQDVTGGGFGGKEDYPEIMGVPLAVAAVKTGKPVRMIFDRSEDMAFTSKRHRSRSRVRTAHAKDGTITGLDFSITLDGGAYESYSLIVLQRAIFTSNGAYNFPNVRVRGRAVATSTVPSGAFRGFGAPQALFALEMHMERVARELKVPALDVRRRYFLKEGDATITGGTIRESVILEKLVEKAVELSDYESKRLRFENARKPIGEPRQPRVTQHDRKAPGYRYRGIGLSVFNHGCGFTGDGEQRIIKGKVRLRKYEDDRVEILASSVDMGQGPQTTFRKVVGSILDIPPESILFSNPDTDAVPDSGPTVASRTMMVVGYSLSEASHELKREWKSGEFQEIESSYAMPPGMSWDQDTLTGDAYATFGWGVNVVEVEVDPVSWETRVVGAWGVYDVGVAIDDRVVFGQIQGGMSQALGYGYLENLEIDARGIFRQRTMADYAIPTSMDLPRTAAATIDNPYEFGPFGAKGMGEMVNDGGHAAFAAAVEQATGSACPEIPLTPERLSEIMER